jgi:putative peptide zinc metalloprotease protein
MTASARQYLPVGEFDGAGDDQRFLVRTGSGAFLSVSPSAYYIVAQRHDGATFEEIARVFSANGQAVSAAEVEAAWQRLTEKLDSADKSASTLPSQFWLDLPLVSAPVVRRIARRLSFIFTPSGACAALATIACAALWALTSAVFRDASWVGALLPAYILFFVTVLVHEFGHAAACQRFGREPGEIGFALYLVYPVLYSDVTGAWALRRWQRVVVDLGGIYAQALCGALYVAAFAATQWRPLGLAAVFVLGNCLFSLNPIFKFDGYWVIADALGLARFSAQPVRLARTLVQAWRAGERPDLPWSRPTAFVIGIYGIVAVVGWAFFLFWGVPHLVKAVYTLPNVVLQAAAPLFLPSHGIAWSAVADCLAALYFGLLAGLGLLNLARTAIARVVPAIQLRTRRQESLAHQCSDTDNAIQNARQAARSVTEARSRESLG